MSLQGEQVLLRLYLRAADRPPHTPSWERLVAAARRRGLAGATVLPGILGFGARGILKPTAWSITEHRPVIVEIVDVPDRIADFVARSFDGAIAGGMATLERAHVMLYRPRDSSPPGPLRQAAALAALSTLPAIESRFPMVATDGVLLRVFIGESDRFEHAPLYEAIVTKARELGLAGATVLRGSEGFGASSVIHKTEFLELSSDLPVVIEMVDSPEKIDRILPHLEAMVREGMVTMEFVRILIYRHDPADAPGPQSPPPPSTREAD